MLAGAGFVLSSGNAFSDEKSAAYFKIHPFNLANQDAVFIMKTNVDVKTNSSAIKKAGLNFGRSVFCATDDEINGIPLSHKVVIKPNQT